MAKRNKTKSTTDLSAKHFSRYGEFLASFELSKYGWNVYNPVYDEYIDLLIHKVVCKNCGAIYNTNPKLICNNCGASISSSDRKNIKANGKCLDCGNFFNKGNKKYCPKCKSENVANFPTCPICKKGMIEIEPSDCEECGSNEYIEKFRTVQVKASRLETDKNSYAVDLKPRDLEQGRNHHYIWVCIDENDLPHFLVVPIKEFEKNAQNMINSTSFLKDQGREHFHAKTFGKWESYLNSFELLE